MTPSAVSTVGDTIVAVATAPGTGAIGIIRISGPAALQVAQGLVRLRSRGGLEGVPPRVLHRAGVIDPGTGAELDLGLVVKMLGPHSYTGEDVVELSCHGNPVLLAQIVRLVVAAGARLAEPGEFTRRAYLNGRLNLVQAESVAELIAARTERAVRLAARQLQGGVSEQISALREGLLELVAGLEVALDFPDDGVGVSRFDGVKRIQELIDGVQRLIASAVRGRTVQQGLTVMLTGAANVGKSSLFNRLLRSERAIVDAVSGTTRDLIDGTVSISGIPVCLTDGAGLGSPRDELDAEGMRRARRAMSESDLLMIVLDGSRALFPEDLAVLESTAGRERIVVANKADLEGPRDFCSQDVDVVCSALTGAGIASLEQALTEWVEARVSVDGEEGGIVASVRVVELLIAAETALNRGLAALERVPTEAALIDLRDALGATDRALGINVDDAVLNRIFSAFCVGK